MTRIAEGTTTGRATYSREYAIGYHDCQACKVETPAPPQSLLDHLAAERCLVTTVWPFEHWNPPGWTTVGGYGHICDTCSRAVMRLLNYRSKPAADPVDISDLTLLRENVSAALDLAATGLLADFPPWPTDAGEIDQRWSHIHGRDLRVKYYREDAFRQQILAIRNVLLGRPANDGGDDG